MEISARDAARLVARMASGGLRIPNDPKPPQIARELYISFKDVNPKNRVIEFYSDAGLTVPANVKATWPDARKWDVDIYAFAGGDEAVRIHIVPTDQKARFDTRMQSPVTAGDERSQDYLRNLTFGQVVGEYSLSFICRIGGPGKGKFLKFSVDFLITDQDGQEDSYTYDPKIKNNGAICNEGDLDPECQ